jgi:hypothetical protein
MSQLIIDSVQSCRCHYCKSSDIREWLQPRLKATAKAGHPRPQISTVHGILVQEFGTTRIQKFPKKVGGWLRQCEPLWESLWDADGKPRDNGSA